MIYSEDVRRKQRVQDFCKVMVSHDCRGQSISKVIMSMHYIISSDSAEGKRKAANSLLTIDHKNNYLYVTELGGHTLSQRVLCDFSLLQADKK